MKLKLRFTTYLNIKKYKMIQFLYNNGKIRLKKKKILKFDKNLFFYSFTFFII